MEVYIYLKKTTFFFFIVAWISHQAKIKLIWDAGGCICEFFFTYSLHTCNSLFNILISKMSIITTFNSTLSKDPIQILIIVEVQWTEKH